MKNIAERKIGGIVAENFKTATVFSKYGIDFCCKGDILLKEACQKHEVPLDKITIDLNEALRERDLLDFQNLTLSQLIDQIIDGHHKYIENTVPPLKSFLNKLTSVHGDLHPELHEIEIEFMKAADALTTHMKKEEFILFPYVKAMEEASKSNFHLSPPHFGHVQNPIQMMEMDHDAEGERFRRISLLTNAYQTPADGCQTYQVAFALLKEFEEDLHMHIHMENNILFPKAIELFNSLNV